MTETREKMIEVMARAMWNENHLSDWECERSCTGIDRATYRAQATAALDAFLSLGVQIPQDDTSRKIMRSALFGVGVISLEEPQVDSLVRAATRCMKAALKTLEG